jgi:predicted nucleic-acid-binding protein
VIGLDTNIIIRYVVQDDPKQCDRVNDLMENRLTVHKPGFITLITLIETVWVLESSYSQPKKVILTVIHSLLATRQLVIERADIVHKAAARYETANADFSDSVIFLLSQDAGCSECFTFDKRARRTGMKLL